MNDEARLRHKRNTPPFSLEGCLAARRSVDLACDVTGFVGTQEDKDGCDFDWLCGSFEGRVFAEVLTFSAGIVAGISGVHTGPGATALTRTPCFMPSCDSVLVRLTIAAFVAA